MDPELELATPAPGGPKSKTDQLDVQAWEAGLVAIARVAHPNVSWWHGYRHVDGGWVSQCYVCDGPVAAWPGGTSPPMTARQDIAKHKHDHHDGIVPSGSTTLEGE